MNSREMTRFGRGIGLEFANSIYFKSPDSQLGYLSAERREQALVRELIRSGHIDSLHSYGDEATLREEAREILEHLEMHDCRLPVWVDHAHAPTNLGKHQTRGFGDELGNAAYHSDLLIRHGICYAWRGQVTGIVGQNSPLLRGRGLVGRLDRWAGINAGAKELVKIGLSICGSNRYSMHASNRVLRRITLRDGTKICEFLRSNACQRGLPIGDSASAISNALGPRVIQALIERRGVMILYTHLGKRMPPHSSPCHRAFVETMERIADYQSRGLLRVLTTSRALDFILAQDAVRATMTTHGQQLFVDLDVKSNDELGRSALVRGRGGGLSVIVPHNQALNLSVAGQPIKDLRISRIVGRPYSIAAIPFPPLEMP